MGTAKRILIVDDEDGYIGMIKDALKLRGMDVDTANNGVAAGMSLASKVPDLILMDIHMPGINGLQACDAIRRNPKTKDVPIIVVSALSDDSNAARAQEIGVQDFLSKPVDMEYLMKRIKEILEIK